MSVDEENKYLDAWIGQETVIIFVTVLAVLVLIGSIYIASCFFCGGSCRKCLGLPSRCRAPLIELPVNAPSTSSVTNVQVTEEEQREEEEEEQKAWAVEVEVSHSENLL